MKKLLLLIFLILLSNILVWGQSNSIIAHSHNDYEQKRPLLNAVENNFQSIEIDILRVGKKLVVTHDDKDLERKPTIDKMYFDRLQKMINNGEIKQKTWLLVDLKLYDKQTLELLHELVTKYVGLFQTRQDVNGPLQIVLSGDIPRKEIINDSSYTFFFIDGRVSDLEENYDSNIMPLISANFTDFSFWKGIGKMKKADFSKIQSRIQAIHKQGKKIRFWKTRDKKKVWKTLIKLNVDVISVDNIESFSKFRKRFNI